MHKSPKILVVDDDPDIIGALSFRLRATGYEVVSAHDGEAGLSTAAVAAPDLILLDLCMPRMDGLTMLSRLRAREVTRTIPVVIISANPDETTSHQARALGARYFIEKPYDSEALIYAIQSSLNMGAVAALRSSPE
jgi:CheY-like chemotaxis protein